MMRRKRINKEKMVKMKKKNKKYKKFKGILFSQI